MSPQRQQQTRFGEERQDVNEVSSVELELAHLYERAPIGLCITDTQHRYVRINEELCGINGKSVEEHVGRTIREVLPHIADQIETMFQKVIDSAEPVLGHEVRGHTSAHRNEERIFVGDHYPLMSKDGRVLYVHTMVRDVTAQRRAETVLRDSNEELEARVKERTAQLEAVSAKLEAALTNVTNLRDQLHAESAYLQQEIKSEHGFDEIVGNSRPLRSLLRMVEHVASTNATVLILGETGTGKELVARALHSRSSRNNHPLVKVNCATIPAGLVESELFGHEEGAFTGAIARALGRFEVANGGTIFLDEIGELTLETQAKLLRVLQEGEFERVGSTETLKVDVRIIAASNRDLEEAINDGTFRRDLFYRLKVFPVELPPLRERREDIPLLVWHFIMNFERVLGRTITKVPKRIMNALQAYDWPGNVRELEHLIQRAMILSPGCTLVLAEALRGAEPAEDAASASLSLQEVERAHILSVMEQCRWKLKGKGNAADRLGLHPSTLRSRMDKLGVERPSLNS